MTTIDFVSLSGPFVLWFNGEGRHCLVLETADQVIEYLMREDGGGWELNGTRDGLIECLNNADDWHFNDDRKPFQWVFEWGEICTVNLIVGVQMPPKFNRLSEITTWPLNDDLRFIFGRPNFACGGVARGLRQIGWEIDTRAEAEQAAVILWMLQMYLEHGPQWPEAVSQFWESAKRSGTGE